jgi:hypothetical protein
MTQHSHQTAPTRFVNAASVRFAYRRFGRSGGVPLALFMHFTGTMDQQMSLRRLNRQSCPQ